MDTQQIMKNPRLPAGGVRSPQNSTQGAIVGQRRAEWHNTTEWGAQWIQGCVKAYNLNPSDQ
jgi:hypothetical protein